MKKTPQTSYFATEEAGRIYPLPIDLEAIVGKAGLGSSTKKDNALQRRRKIIPIEPLKISSMDLGDTPHSHTKKRKIEMPIRKELFKIPARKVEKRASNAARRSMTKNKKSVNKKISKLPSIVLNNGATPLLDVDEAEKLLTRGNLNLAQFRRTTVFPLQDKENTPPLKCDLNDNDKTPTSGNESLNEFIQLEKQFPSAKKLTKTKKMSPMTSFCNLFQETDINCSSDTISEIIVLVNEENNQFQDLQLRFQDFQDKHQQRMKKIQVLLEKFSGKTKRRSRIASNVISPVMTQKIDLRKTTLNRNLKSTINETPNTQKALKLYNSFRSDYSVLCTPKMDNTLHFRQTSVTRSLSRRVQQQCLALQDTPKVLF